jgi:hypothetical protein
MTTGLGSAPTPAEGFEWRRPPDGRLAHRVPTGENFTLCGLITNLTDRPWPLVFDADLANDVDWCLTCGDHSSAADRSRGPMTTTVSDTQGPLPPAPSGHSWQIPDTGATSRIAHLVPDGGSFTVCGLALGDKGAWHKVLGVDEANVPWHEDCYRISQESLGGSIWIAFRPEDVVREKAERHMNGSRTPAEVRRTLAELDARMSTSSRGAVKPRSRAANSIRKSGRAATLSPAPRPPNERRLHDPFSTCAVCAEWRQAHPGAALTASGFPAGCPSHHWFGTFESYREWLASQAPRRRSS